MPKIFGCLFSATLSLGRGSILTYSALGTTNSVRAYGFLPIACIKLLGDRYSYYGSQEISKPSQTIETAARRDPMNLILYLQQLLTHSHETKTPLYRQGTKKPLTMSGLKKWVPKAPSATSFRAPSECHGCRRPGGCGYEYTCFMRGGE